MTTGMAQSSTDKWWTGYGNGPDNSRYFASQQINKSNVNQLQVAWTYPFGETGSNPIVARGVIYGRGRNGSIVAVDAKTGKELWVREKMNGMISRGMKYWESRDGRDQRLIFPMNSLLQQLDAKTGKSIMSFGTNGVVDLRVGIDGRDPATIGNIQSQTPGEVFENLVILGSAPGEGYMSPPGDIRAYDVLTGKLVWTFHTVPRPGEFGYDTWPKDAWKYIGGTNNWGEMTVDTAARDRLRPDRIADLRLLRRRPHRRQSLRHVHRGARRAHGQAPLALSVGAPRSLGFRQERRAAAHDDPPQRPQPGCRRRRQQDRLALRLRSRDGRGDVADRRTSGTADRHAGRAELADAALSDQPAAFREANVRRRRYQSRPASRRRRKRFKQRVLAANNKGMFTPISLKDTVHIPGSNGGALFGGTAAEPDTGAVYLITQDNPGMLRLLRASENAAVAAAAFTPPGQLLYQQHCQQCHGADRLGTGDGVPLVYADADPANNIVAGAPRFTAAAIRAILTSARDACRRSRTSAPPTSESSIRYLTTPEAGTGAAVVAAAAVHR